jgi:hypothetical protein
LNASPRASAKCLSGKIEPIVLSQGGSSTPIRKMSETKASSRITVEAIPCTAELERTRLTSASPRAAKQPIPIASVTTDATRVRPRICTW